MSNRNPTPQESSAQTFSGAVVSALQDSAAVGDQAAAAASQGAKLEVHRPPPLPAPRRRPLRVYAFDPSRGRLLGNELELSIRHRPLEPGPVDVTGASDQIAVVDYDASRRTYYRPVDLDEPAILISNGLAPSEFDPRFHQQMVYAVVSDTIEHFEEVLGRRIHWRRAERPQGAPRGWKPGDILTLTLYPHAMQQANAFYSPDAHGILFGYFPAGRVNAGHNIAGQTVFTCLSHDVIVHETTHAILDGLRSHFMEQTNPDVAAFHEAFADLVALFRHFSHREVVLDTIQRTGGRLYAPALSGDTLADRAGASWIGESDEPNPLIGLAAQFGEALGLRQGLRSAIGKPKTMKQLRDTTECHERGSVLVAAVFDAFFTVYLQRAARHFRIFRSAGGTAHDDLTAPLADALAGEATRTAADFFRTCVRAVDYLPPMDVTFGDFLRAVITSEVDYDREDREGIREAWMQAFRRREILPDDAPFFSEEGLKWLDWGEAREPLYIDRLPSGGPFGLAPADRQHMADRLTRFLEPKRIRERLGLDPTLECSLPSFHPVCRTDSRGSVRLDYVVEVIQTARAQPNEFPFRGGTTLLISTHSTGGGGRQDDRFIRYAICKPLDGPGGPRAERQKTFLQDEGRRPDKDGLRINFALVHGGMSS